MSRGVMALSHMSPDMCRKDEESRPLQHESHPPLSSDQGPMESGLSWKKSLGPRVV